MIQQFGDVRVELGDDFIATVEIHRPPNNFFDVELIRSLAIAYESLDDHAQCRAVILCSEGKHFCAGANFGASDSGSEVRGDVGELYSEAVRLFETTTPVVAVVQGGAIGGGLALACSADFRVASPQARFSANFARLGFHHGFGLTVTLPAIVGAQRSLEMLYTGRRVGGAEAFGFGLCDRLVAADQLRAEARLLASEIAGSAPLAIRSIRQTMRGDLPARVRSATEREYVEQARLRRTADFSEGLRASAGRRAPRFEGR